MAPAEHLLGKRGGDHLPPDEKADHCAAQPLGKERFRDRRQTREASRRLEDAVGDERMHVGVEVDEIAEGLDEKDEAGAVRGCATPHAAVSDRAMMRLSSPSSDRRWAKSGRISRGTGEDIVAVRNRPQHATLDPLAVSEDALLMAAWAEVARLAGEGEQQVVTAAGAADACEAAVQIAALEKALEHAHLDGAPHAIRSAQLRKVATDALPQGTRARLARAIDRRAIGLHVAPNAGPVAATQI
jgi:hypothetical protein